MYDSNPSTATKQQELVQLHCHEVRLGQVSLVGSETIENHQDSSEVQYISTFGKKPYLIILCLEILVHIVKLISKSSECEDQPLQFFQTCLCIILFDKHGRIQVNIVSYKWLNAFLGISCSNMGAHNLREHFFFCHHKLSTEQQDSQPAFPLPACTARCSMETLP